LAKELGMSAATLHRIWQKYGLQPHCQRICDPLASQPGLQLGSIRFADFHRPTLYAHAA
jgi:hypothetical protein